MSGALSHLQEAGASASRTMGKMHKQTAQLDKMNKGMDEANKNLDSTEATITDMEKGYMQYLAEGALGAVGINMGAKVDTSGSLDTSTVLGIIKEGWLHKRGPMYGYKWESRWCTLYETGIAWFDDEKKGEKKGDSEIKKGTKSFAFQKNKAPGDAIKHRGEKPFGFVVDVTPNAGPGKERRLMYFDAGSKNNQDAWLDAIAHAAHKLKKKEKGGDDGNLGVSEMDQVNDALDGLHHQALDLGTEAKKQAKLVNQVTTKVDSTTARLDAQTARVKKL